MLNRIVLLDEGGAELFSGISIASDPPPAQDEDACPPTLRSIAPPPTTEESGVFVRGDADETISSQKKVDVHAA